MNVVKQANVSEKFKDYLLRQHGIYWRRLVVCSYKKQMVAGTNYEVTMAPTFTGAQVYWLVTIFVPLPNVGSAPEVKSIVRHEWAHSVSNRKENVVYPTKVDIVLSDAVQARPATSDIQNSRNS